MLSNFDIEEIANHYNLDVQIIMKDELKNMKPINTNYIINLDIEQLHFIIILEKNVE